MTRSIRRRTSLTADGLASEDTVLQRDCLCPRKQSGLAQAPDTPTPTSHQRQHPHVERPADSGAAQAPDKRRPPERGPGRGPSGTGAMSSRSVVIVTWHRSPPGRDRRTRIDGPPLTATTMRRLPPVHRTPRSSGAGVGGRTSGWAPRRAAAPVLLARRAVDQRVDQNLRRRKARGLHLEPRRSGETAAHDSFGPSRRRAVLPLKSLGREPRGFESHSLRRSEAPFRL